MLNQPHVATDAEPEPDNTNNQEADPATQTPEQTAELPETSTAVTSELTAAFNQEETETASQSDPGDLAGTLEADIPVDQAIDPIPFAALTSAEAEGGPTESLASEFDVETPLAEAESAVSVP